MKKIIEQIKATPRMLALTACLLVLAIGASLLTAATSIGVLPATAVLNSANSTTTNLIFGPTTNGIWPNAIVGGGIVTNLLVVDVSAYKEVTIEIAGASQVAPGAVTGQEVDWTIYKNVAGGSPTNAIGTGLLLETAGTVTNRFAASSAANAQVVSSLTLAGGNAGAPTTGQAGQLGGITTLYIGKCDATTLTNASYYTNYTVWVYGKK